MVNCDWLVVFKLWSLQQHYLGTCWKYKFLGPNPDLPNQKPQGMAPEICVFTSPPGDMHVQLMFENAGLNHVAFAMPGE